MKPSKEYAWLDKEPGPRILVEALALYGVKEVSGEENSHVILGWAHELGGWIGSWYSSDSVPWCGLFIAICTKRAGFPFDQKALSAREWVRWGERAPRPMLGDVLIFTRKDGGHVGIYVGEDDVCYHVLGGNQSDAVNITRISKDRLLAARRCKWKKEQPSNVRPIFLMGNGAISENEA